MNRRQSPCVRLAGSIRDVVHSGYEVLESVGAGNDDRRRANPTTERSSDSSGEVRDGGPRSERPSTRSNRFDPDDRLLDDATVAALLDPERGPTNRSDILEYGCSPEQYVGVVVAEHGGRVKQRRFVDEYGWSPSTISRLLLDLEERGVIERFRISREKVVRLSEGN